MKKIVKEFRDFAVKGNAAQLATAVVIGAAFGKITTSFVSDIVMPFATLLTKEDSFTSWKVILRKASYGSPAVTMNIGNFIQNIVDFLIIALSIFFVIKLVSKVNNQIKSISSKDDGSPEEPELKLTKEQELLTEIRDLVKNKELNIKSEELKKDAQ